MTTPGHGATELRDLLTQHILQQLALKDFQALHNTCQDLRALVQTSPQEVWEAAASRTGYPLVHSPPGCSWYSRMGR